MVNFITNKPAIPANSTHVPLGCIILDVLFTLFPVLCTPSSVRI